MIAVLAMLLVMLTVIPVTHAATTGSPAPRKSGGSAEAATNFPRVSEATGLSVVIKPEGGERYTITADQGEELGDYRAPSGRFVQRCIRVVQKGGPTIYFRPDRGSNRVEVIFENWAFHAIAAHLAPYSVEILRNGAKIGEANVPTMQWWGSRWRWQSSPRPMIHDVRDLIAAKLIQPYKDVLPLPRRMGPVPAYTPMGFAGLTPYMPMTGERDDIGPQTEAIAEYLITSSDTARTAMLAQAEAAGSWQIHARDEATGAPISKDHFPRLNFYYDQQYSDPRPPQLHADAAGTFDEAHAPNESYVPFLLTEDPYDLEELQFAVNATFMASIYRTDGALIQDLQLRGWAWALRNLFELVRVMPAEVPRWFLPAAYFRKRLDLTLTWIDAHWLNAGDPWTAFSHVPIKPGQELFPPWQDDMLTAMLGYGVYLGFADWRPIFEWKLATAKARLNGTSGYPRTEVIQYELPVVKLADPGKPLITSWSDVARYRYNPDKKAYDPLVERSSRRLAPTGNDYPNYLYGVLAIALLLGDDSVRPLYDWYTPQITTLSYRWSYGIGPGK